MVNTHALERRSLHRTPARWWRLLYRYLRDADTMRDNPLLERVIRRQPRLPKWRPQIGWLWFLLPFAAMGAVVLAAQSIGLPQRSARSTAVGISFAAGICAYPPYLLGGGIALLIPARVAPVLSREIEGRTLDVLRLTNLSSDEIVLGRLLGPLIPFSGLLNYVATFFVLIVILGALGASAVPLVLGLPPGETVIAIVLTELPLLFGPLVHIFFVSALSLAISAHTSHPDTSIATSYGVVLAYWMLTGAMQIGALAVLRETVLPGSLLVRSYTASPVAFLYPNVLRVLLSAVMAPVLIHVAVRRVETL